MRKLIPATALAASLGPTAFPAVSAAAMVTPGLSSSRLYGN
jgi:hypothetical protein